MSKINVEDSYEHQMFVFEGGGKVSVFFAMLFPILIFSLLGIAIVLEESEIFSLESLFYGLIVVGQVHFLYTIFTRRNTQINHIGNVIIEQFVFDSSVVFLIFTVIGVGILGFGILPFILVWVLYGLLIRKLWKIYIRKIKMSTDGERIEFEGKIEFRLKLNLILKKLDAQTYSYSPKVMLLYTNNGMLEDTVITMLLFGEKYVDVFCCTQGNGFESCHIKTILIDKELQFKRRLTEELLNLKKG